MIEPETWLLVDLWRAWRGAGLAGGGTLPAAGGMLDQPACIMESLAIFDAAFEKVKPKKPG